MCRECECAEQDADHATTIAAEWAHDTDPQARARRNQDYTDTGTTTRGDGPGDDNRCRSHLRAASRPSVHAQRSGRPPAAG